MELKRYQRDALDDIQACLVALDRADGIHAAWRDSWAAKGWEGRRRAPREGRSLLRPKGAGADAMNCVPPAKAADAMNCVPPARGWFGNRFKGQKHERNRHP